MPDLYFAIPGDLHTLTGGYGYDRRLFSELALQGIDVKYVPLAGTFPTPDAAALSDADYKLAALPTGAIVLIDGLAFGVMDELASKHSARLKLIALCHHPLAREAGLTSAKARQLHQSEQRSLAQALAVIATSAATAAQLEQDFSVPLQKISVAPPGTDAQTFASCAGDPPCLLTVATLTRRKAHDVLLAALVKIKHLPWKARWVGGSHFDSSWAESLRDLIATHDLQGRIEFVGELTDVRSEFLQADLCVFPSHYEGYGMACAEALAFGLPVVATSVGAVPELIPSTAGLLVAPGNAAELADALGAVLDTQGGAALRARLQQGARAAARNLSTWSDTARIVADRVREVRR